MIRRKPPIQATGDGAVAIGEVHGDVTVHVGATDEPKLNTDLVLRGPIAHLGLAETLREVETTEPSRAAALYGEIVAKLRDSGYAALAPSLRDRQLTALVAAGKLENAAKLGLELAWESVLASHAFDEAEQLRHTLFDVELPEPYASAVAMFDAVRVAVDEDGTTRTEELWRAWEAGAARADGPTGGEPSAGPSPFAGHAAVVLAEHALAMRDTAILTRHRELLERVAAQAPSPELALRIRLCLADASGDWTPLTSGMRTGLPPQHQLWVLARRARYLALSGDASCVDVYADAIATAAQQKLWSEVRELLVAHQRAVYWYQGAIRAGETIMERRSLVRGLTDNLTTGILPAAGDRQRNAAMEALRAKRHRVAWHAARAWLRAAVASGFVAEEQSASAALADVYLESGEHLAALSWYIRGDEAERATEVASALPDEPLDLFPDDVYGTDVTVRETAYTALLPVADLLTDKAARAWLVAAVADLDGTPVEPSTLKVVTPQWSLLTELVAVADSAPSARTEARQRDKAIDAKQLLDIVDAEIRWDREPGTGYVNDAMLVATLVNLGFEHPDLTVPVVERLCRLLPLLDRDSASTFRRHAIELLADHSEHVTELLSSHVQAGNTEVSLTLLYLGETSPELRDFARAELAAAENRGQGGTHFGPLVAATPALDPPDRQRMTRFITGVARDNCETAATRVLALEVGEAVATKLPDDARTELFALGIAFAEGRAGASRGDDVINANRGKLGALTLSGFNVDLRRQGLRTAAASAHTPQQREAIVSRAFSLLHNPDAVADIAQALRLIPNLADFIELDQLAHDPRSDLRAVAAVHGLDSLATPTLNRLARDPSPHVRYSLLSQLDSEQQAHEPLLRILADDPRRAIRSTARTRLA
ncbi:hypothetical protein [Stackebrandtia nassauensis]|uniref:Uncharacterized protein n=1 Tax=Stackebrandtia nassauensis (strain DSM 44728 / CIP 108903 / NRRL B-16338 / NBRC 102104 / LLR-40K-21) TaxID=446470 RepID=D3PU81_STANL|nr:hypothetical protein [Stackebrandtia nassauensis]ADD41027.1 hypothetical protein Snas_1318 [Stackebrandtia nassauensis DSM 44728]